MIEWTDAERVVMNDLVAIAISHSHMLQDLRVLVKELDGVGSRGGAMLQDIIDKYTDVPDE